MSAASTIKQSIIDLWGLSISEIDTKLAMLQSIIGGLSESVLLDYLLRADLNIDRAIDLHFGSTPSPSPIPKPLTNISNSINAQSNSANTNHNNNSSNKMELSDSDSSDIELMLDLNVSNTNRKRKRESIVSEPQISNEQTEQPRNKRRKIDQTSLQNTDNSNANNANNSNNSNSNNSNSNAINSNVSLAIESKQNSENIIANYDPKWKTKKIVTLKFTVVDIPSHRRRYKINSVYHLHVSLTQKTVEITNFECDPATHFHTTDKAKMNKMYTDCVCDLYSARASNKLRSLHVGFGMTQLMKVKKISDNMNEIENYKQKLENGMKSEVHRWGGNGLKLEERAAYAAGLLNKYEIRFEVSFEKRTVLTKSLKCEQFSIMALFGGSKQLFENMEMTDKIDEIYTKEKHSYNMLSLLDFACRDEYKINALNNNQFYNHGLNVSLHEYQLQSLDFMVSEENNEIGFYRHFYKRGMFPDATSFRYSKLFSEIVFDMSDLVAHGGFLCEEMGLGKTIISLALINCNKPNDSSLFSHKNQLKVTRSETRQQCRTEMDRSDPQNIKWKTIHYTEHHKWYKSAATLIIAPVSLVGQWEKECDERSDDILKYKRYYGGSRSRDVNKYIDQDIVFTTYGILGSEKGEKANHVLHHIIWHRIILDESHYIKNGNTKTAKSVNLLQATNKWCLTGTPFNRTISDIHNQLKFIGMKDKDLSVLKLQTIAKEKYFERVSLAFCYQKMCKPLLFTIKSLVIRHTKAQKFNDKAIVTLPDKTENIIFVEFTEKQRVFYDKLYATAKQRFDYYKSIGNIGRGSLSILSSLHPSRQACSGCVLQQSSIESELAAAEAKTLYIQSMVHLNRDLKLSKQELFAMAKEEAFNYSEDGECPICFECPYEEPLQTLCRHIFCRECIQSYLRQKHECPMCRQKATVSQLRKPPSKENKNENNNKSENESKEEKKESNSDDIIRFDSKMKVLIAELNKIREKSPNEKALIFTSFSKSLDWLCSELQKNGFEYRTLSGQMSMNKRKKQLNEFQNNSAVKVFVLTVRSGAVGITLTAANHVFICEPPFNAALYSQAINRVYRLGQRKKVSIHTLIMKDSIEEKIWNINKAKQGNGNGNNDTAKNSNHNRRLAGNISGDKSANLQQSEIEKLFE